MLSNIKARVLRRPVVGFWVLVACYWALVWRTPVWDIDDLYFATRSGTLGGRIDWSGFAHLAVYDLVDRNGRFSDMMVQLIMSTGGWIRVPLVLSSLSLSLALWLMLRRVVRDLRGTISPGLDLLAGAEAFLVPMALIGIDPHMGGDTIMFIAANIGYMWGLALGVAAILLLWSQRGPNVKHGWVLWAAVLLSFVASVHHELNALGAVGAVVAMALITPAGKWTVRWAAALAVTAVGKSRGWVCRACGPEACGWVGHTRIQSPSGSFLNGCRSSSTPSAIGSRVTRRCSLRSWCRSAL